MALAACHNSVVKLSRRQIMASGSCLCGTVKFSVNSADEASSHMSHCHCSMCRKIHGSLFATYFNATGLNFSQGENAIVSYESSPGFIRSFCQKCGSPLPEKSTANDDEVYVPAGLMDDDSGVRPEEHIFAESKAECYDITDALPQREHYGDGDLSRVIDIPDNRSSQSSQSKSHAVTGGCQCGAVTFEYTGTPKMMMNCHCSRCRKAKGAAHATNAFVAADDLNWTSGENNITEYAHPDAKFFGHAFCKSCGSSVPRPRPDGSVYNVPVGSLNQAPGIEAKGHIFIGSKAPWFEVTDDKPQWDEMPT